jgi:hypothetical protein
VTARHRLALPMLRPANLDDLDSLTDLESRSYPSDEAATRETLKLRLTLAPECTVLRIVAGSVQGFVCSTRAVGQNLTAVSMKEHIAGAETLCIHSVVVDPALRKRGIGVASGPRARSVVRDARRIARLTPATKKRGTRPASLFESSCNSASNGRHCLCRVLPPVHRCNRLDPW